ncbi:MAG: cytochrome c [Acidimicrobiales bacterium]
MTEVPEYLLKRSRERREALGLGGGGSGAGSGGEGEAAGTPSPSAPAVQESAPAAAAAPPPAAAAASQVEAAAGPPAFTVSRPRSGIPVWMMPVILIFPLWAVVYAGAFTETKAKVVDPGAAAYLKGGCGACHGPTGAGGVGPKLSGGDAKLTFPNEADHVAWIETGSGGPNKGKPYGDPNRPGGPRPPSAGGMPAFKGTLTDEEIKAVVVYEREQL